MNILKHPDRWFLIPGIVLGISYFFNVGGYPLMEPDEGRNAGVAQAMADSNAYLVPRHNSLPYVDKPVLYFAAGALVMEVLGPSEFAARLPSLLFTFCTLGVVAWFGTLLFDRRTGWLAAFITGAMPLTLAFSRTVIFDAAVTLFVTAAIAGLYVAVESEKSSDRRQVAVLAAWGAMALGVLTKGPIALGLPLFVMLPYAMARKRGSHVFDSVAVLAFVALLLPWLLVMSNAAPGYMRYVLLTETVNRFATDELRRTGPWWYFLPILVAGAAPWSLLVLGVAARDAKRFVTRAARDPRALLLVTWIVIPLVFFSLSQSKRVQYILPLLPAFGLAAAWAVRNGQLTRGVRVAASATLAVVGAVLLSAPAIVPPLVETTEAIRNAIPPVAVLLGATTILAAVILLAGGQRPRLQVAALAAPVLLIPVVSVQLMAAIGENRSSRTMADAIRQVTDASVEVVGVHTYPTSLGYYLQRNITVATHDGRELTSNYISAFFAEWLDRSAVLQIGDWWIERLANCETPAVFVVSRDDAANQQALAATLPLISLNRKFAAYGPCVPGSLARMN